MLELLVISEVVSLVVDSDCNIEERLVPGDSFNVD